MDIKEQDRLYMDPPSDDWSGRRVVRRREVRVLRLEEGVWGILPTSMSVHTARPVGPPAGLLLALNARASRPMDTYLARAR